MLTLCIQCPSCGLVLRHGERLLARVHGRRGATRCPGCRSRVCFDATEGTLRITFPDLESPLRSHPPVLAPETVAPPLVSEASSEVTRRSPEVRELEGSESIEAALEEAAFEHRWSRVVARRPSAMPPALPAEALAQGRIPWELQNESWEMQSEDFWQDDEPVISLLPVMRIRRNG